MVRHIVESLLRGSGARAATSQLPGDGVTHMKALLTRLVVEEKGQDVIEYALLAAAISVVAVPTVPSIGSAVNNAYLDINTKVQSIPGAS